MVRVTSSTHGACYNGDYIRGNDWYDLPHYVQEADGECEELHLYYRYTNYLQLDNRDQEVYGWHDYYDGGYASGSWDGDSDEVNQCYAFACFEFFQANAEVEEEEAEEAEEAVSDEWVTVSGHSTYCYNGDYYRGIDWYDLPHYV